MTFDAREMKQLPAGQHLTSPDFPGLRLVAGPRFKTWTYRYKSPVDGRMKQIKIGRWPAMSLHAAVAEWEKLRAERDQGADPAGEAKEVRAVAKLDAERERADAVKAAYTVQRVCDDYHLGHVRLARARKGSAEVDRMFRTMLGDLAGVPASNLTRAQAFDLIKSCAEATPVQAKKLRAELGAAWDYAIDSGRLPQETPNWWRMILRGKVQSLGKKLSGKNVGTEKRVLSAQEVGTLLRWLPNFTALIEDALIMYLWTGTRGSEICGMRGNEVVLEGDVWWWTIPKSRTKNVKRQNATDLRVPLFGRALNVVLRRKERYGDSYLFAAKTATVKPVEQKTIQASVFGFQPYCETRPEWVRPRLTVTHWAPHDLRRTARTLLAALGCPDEVGEAILGHMKPGIVGVYNLHRYDVERGEWLKRLDEHLEALAVAR
jgi:integrase